MSGSPIESRTALYVLLLAVWAAFMALLWLGLGALPASGSGHDVGTFALIVATLFVWTEVHERLARGRSRWHPRTWRE